MITVYPSLHPNCHHQLVYAKFNLQIYYPPQYYREVWHYKDADTELIRRAIDGFNWQKAFSNKNVNEKVDTFNKTILNILSNFIPHETITCDDRDPPWFNKKIKSLIYEKNTAFKKFRCNRNNSFIKRQLNILQDRIITAIQASKQKYYCRMTNKLINTQKSSKAYWSLLKAFLNNKKIPLIPRLFQENCFITDFKEKAELFNSFFAKQCFLIRNKSKKICGSTIYRPLEITFKEALSTGLFLSEWKKGNIVPIHKKGDKQVLKNYRPVSLLPICGKVFERLIFNEMFSFLLENNLVSPNQSGFKLGDSCINQLLSITHEIFQSFDEGFEVSSVFLDISKAFDKVWHKELIFKLSQNGISGNLLDILSDFLSDRKQRVVLNGQKSTWENVNAGVPQGSILGPLLFLIYINDLSGDLSSKTKLFADDTSLFNVAHDINISANELNNDLKKFSNWAFQWKMSFNPDPSKQAQEVIFS